MKNNFLWVISASFLSSTLWAGTLLTTTYTNIYTSTQNCRSVYSINSGTTWNPMFNQQCGNLAVDSNQVMYVTVPDAFSGVGALVYSSDGVTWTPITVTWPSETGDNATTVFAFNGSLYVGTENGYVLSSSNQGATWNTVATPSQLDTWPITSLFVASNGTIYVGTYTGTGNIWYTSDNGTNWTGGASPDGSGILSITVSSLGTWYVITGNNSLYYSIDNGGIWLEMSINWPSGDTDDYPLTIFSYNSTLYLGSGSGYLLMSLDGILWTPTSSAPDGLNSSVSSIFVNQAGLSPLFVESTGVIPTNGSQSSVNATNLSTSTVMNVQAQLPGAWSEVTQTPDSNCTLVLPQGTCTLKFTSSTPYAPQNIPIVGEGTSGAISMIGLVFSMNGYYVYNVNAGTAYVVDNADVGVQVWSQTDDVIPGISDNDTAPPCNGATDGKCNTQQIVTYYTTQQGVPYSDYAAGLCYQSTNGGAQPGSWSLPSTCELNGGVYYNNTTMSEEVCSPVTTGIFSLYSLGFLSDLATVGSYWSSTKNSLIPDSFAWLQGFFVGGGGFQGLTPDSFPNGVRCVQGLTY